MRIGARKDARTRPVTSAKQEHHAGEEALRAGAWQLTPSALIPFGSYMPPRNSRRSPQGSDRR